MSISDLRVLAIGLCLALHCPVSFGQATDDNDWWFDVELIAFKRADLDQSEERFSNSLGDRDKNINQIDLLSIALFQQANPYYYLSKMAFQCEPSTALLKSNINSALPDLTNEEETKFPGFEFEDSEQRMARLLSSNDCISTPELADAKNRFVDSYLERKPINKIPSTLSVSQRQTKDRAHLLSSDQLLMNDFAERLFKQRDIKALAHFAWRQPVVFGEDNAPFYRIIAGERLQLPAPKAKSYEELSAIYEPDNTQLIEQNSENFFEELKQQLAQAQPITWRDSNTAADTNIELQSKTQPWELDGQFKVYLKYINRVPYLHIDADFDYHEINLSSLGEPVIERYPFKQRRRIISKQIHYFDHPKVGFAIRLVRYEKPKEEEVVD